MHVAGGRSWVAEGARFFGDMRSCHGLIRRVSGLSYQQRVESEFLSSPQQPGPLNHGPGPASSRN